MWPGSELSNEGAAPSIPSKAYLDDQFIEILVAAGR